MAKATEGNGQSMQLSSRCPLCSAEFKSNNAEILDESRQGILFHLTCPSCHSSLLAVVAASKLGLSSFGMVTDLTAADTKRLRRGNAISHEDVLQAYQELANFKGSFKNMVNHGKHLA
ncbi:MAG: hypothetical protein V1895_03445 [Parcubacteria group bacterium]